MKARLVGTSLLLACLLSVHARADSFRVRLADGLLMNSPKECGPVTRDEIEALIAADLQLHVTGEDVRYTQRDSTYEGYVADKVYTNDNGTIGIWYRGRRSIVMDLRQLKKPTNGYTHFLAISFVVEKDQNKRSEVSCFERWEGHVKP